MEAAEVVRVGHRQYLSDGKQVAQAQQTPGQAHYLQGTRPTGVAEVEAAGVEAAEVRQSFYGMHLIHRLTSDHIHSQIRTLLDSRRRLYRRTDTCLQQGQIHTPVGRIRDLMEAEDILPRQG